MRCPQMVKTVGQSSIFFNKNTKIILGGLYPQDLMTFEKAQFPVLERSFSSYERLFPYDKDRSLDPSLHTGQFTDSCNSSFKGYDALIWPLLICTYTHMFTTTKEVRTIKYALGVDIDIQTITITNNVVLT